MLCYVLGVYALSLSVGKFGLARAWTGTKRQQMVMYILAGDCGCFQRRSDPDCQPGRPNALVVAAAYSLFTGIQMLLTMYLLLQQPAQKPTEPSSALKRGKRLSAATAQESGSPAKAGCPTSPVFRENDTTHRC